MDWNGTSFVEGWKVVGSNTNPPAGIPSSIGLIAAYALCNDATP